MRYKSEKEFLDAYDASVFDRPSVTSDILIFSVSDAPAENWRRTNKKSFSVLLVKRDDYPDLGKWNLPGGFVGMNETSMDAAHRILKRETGVRDSVYLEQLYTFDTPNRDPRTRVISIAYMALVDKSKLRYIGTHTAKWFDIKLDNNKLIFSDELKESDLAFDHRDIIKMGMMRLRNKIEWTDIVFDMMPREFTLGELQQVYEIILDKTFIPTAFRRMIASKVVAIGKMCTGAGHRPSALFRKKG
ncbi:MAG: NUDIX hydrolase [Rickettsiales bacterium]|jgi:ADP-ribose pyrophosphatase YjhB (NUDIX family)|nr:NUDIX hydrolase [Rickettsiales bacterium]